MHLTYFSFCGNIEEKRGRQMETKQKELFSVGDFVIIHKKIYRVTKVFTKEKRYRVESMFRRKKGDWRFFFPNHEDISEKYENLYLTK